MQEGRTAALSNFLLVEFRAALRGVHDRRGPQARRLGSDEWASLETQGITVETYERYSNVCLEGGFPHLSVLKVHIDWQT